jgi:hypothetical protein
LNRRQKKGGSRDGLTTQPIRKLRIGQRGEGLGNLGVGDALVVDDESFEERLVPQAAWAAGAA